MAMLHFHYIAVAKMRIAQPMPNAGDQAKLSKWTRDCCLTAWKLGH
jgi:hypothetical protein